MVVPLMTESNKGKELLLEIDSIVPDTKGHHLADVSLSSNDSLSRSRRRWKLIKIISKMNPSFQGKSKKLIFYQSLSAILSMILTGIMIYWLVQLRSTANSSDMPHSSSFFSLPRSSSSISKPSESSESSAPKLLQSIPPKIESPKTIEPTIAPYKLMSYGSFPEAQDDPVIKLLTPNVTEFTPEVPIETWNNFEGHLIGNTPTPIPDPFEEAKFPDSFVPVFDVSTIEEENGPFENFPPNPPPPFLLPEEVFSDFKDNNEGLMSFQIWPPPESPFFPSSFNRTQLMDKIKSKALSTVDDVVRSLMNSPLGDFLTRIRSDSQSEIEYDYI